MKKSALSELEMRKIAESIERIFASINNSTDFYFKKRDGLLRSFLIDQKNKRIYVFLKSKNKSPTVLGAYKKFSTVIALPFDTSASPFLAAQIVNKMSSIDPDKANEQLQNELLLHQQIPSAPRVFYSFTYPKKVTNPAHPPIRKFCLITELFENSADNLVSQIIDDSLKLQVAVGIALGIECIHKLGYIHGDLKLKNVLYLQEKDTIKIAITDFGFTHDPSIKLHWTLRKEGFYGSFTETPPELLGNIPFKGNCQKLEAWVLGTMLLQLFSKKPIPWRDFLRTKPRDWYQHVTYTEKNQFVKIVNDFHKQLLLLLESSFYTETEKTILKIALRLTNVSPGKRLDIESCVKELRNLQTQLTGL
jgi:serine/threonine protein kinase